MASLEICLIDHLLVFGILLDECQKRGCVFLTTTEIGNNCPRIIKLSCKPSAMDGG